ncbi:MAG: T9SS type A sorting domain-containing protein [Bacteroidetes bacterium]|nr:T9SS type A sorting domain-containing protein [Bacteroidota bacterium]
MKNELQKILISLAFVALIAWNSMACDYTIVLKDATAFGWFGSTVTVNVDGVAHSNAADLTLLSGSETSFTFSVSDGEVLTTSFTLGQFAFTSDNFGYYIEDADGNIVLYDGTDASGNVIITETPSGVSTGVTVTCPIPSNFDIAVNSWSSPGMAMCDNDANQMITVELVNNGNQDATGFTVNYTIDGGSVVTETYNQTLAAGASENYSFTAVDFSAIGDYVINAYVDLTGDADNSNDAISWTVTTYTTITITDVAPFTEGFGSGSSDLQLVTNAESNASIYDMGGEFVLRLEGAGIGGWTGTAFGTTESNAWNDNTDHHASGYACNVDATQIATCELLLDLKQIYQNGPTYSWFRVLVNGTQVADINGNSNFNPTTPTGDSFASLTFDLDTYAGQSFTLELQACNKYSEAVSAPGNVAFIDNLIVREKLALDIGVIDIVSPTSSCGLGSSEDMVVTVFNFGVAAVTDFDISYTVDGAGSSDNVTAVNIAAGGSYTHTFTGVDFSTVAYHTVVVTTTLVNDADNTNDAFTETIVSLPTIVVDNANPYNQSFESTHYWLSGGQLSTWELGAPNGNVINYTSYGTNVWMTGLNTFYNNNEQSYVESPCFDFTNLILPSFQFSFSVNTEDDFDAASVQYSIDGGSNWENILSGTGGQTWATSACVALDWSGATYAYTNTNSWVGINAELAVLAGEPNVKFRFVFGADASNNSYDGFAFDNINIVEVANVNDIGVLSWVTPLSTACNLANNEVVTVEVKNYGVTSVSNFDLRYSLDNGSNYVTETVASTIQAGDTLTYSFTTTADFSGAGTYECIAVADLPADSDASNDGVSISITTSGIDEIVGEFELGNTTTSFGYDYGANALATFNAGKFSFKGSAANTDWTGGSALGGTTADQAWNINTTHQSSAFTCNVDATSLTTLELLLDLKQSYLNGPGYSWFRVLLNGTQISDVNGTSDFHPLTENSDPYSTIYFDLTGYEGTEFILSLESANKYDDNRASVRNLIIREKLATDAGVVGFVSPISDCGLTGTQDVTVSVKNYGTSIIMGGLDVTYQIDGIFVTETISSNIFAGSTFDYTFTQGVDFSTFGGVGTYVFNAWVDSTFDSYEENNEFLGHVVDYFDHDFGAGAYNESFEVSEPLGWATEDINNDGIDWLRFFNTQNAQDGDYSYGFDFSTGSANDWLFTQCFQLDATETYQISFWYNSYLSTTNKDLYVKMGTAQNAAGMNTDLLFFDNVNTSDVYEFANTMFTVPSSGTYYFGWKTFGNSTFSAEYMLIDNIEIKTVTPPDVEITALLAPVSACEFTNSEVVSVTVTNNGPGDIDLGTVIPLSYELGGNTVTENYTLTSDFTSTSSFTYSFIATADLSALSTDYDFDITVAYEFDNNTGNDTKSYTVQSFGYPTVTFTGFNGVGYCVGDAAVTLVGDPLGGTFSGTGISGDQFDPAVAGVGTFDIQYDYTDVNACASFDLQSVIVSDPIVDLGTDITTLNVATVVLDAGANANFTYLWSTGETTQTITGLDFGVYSVTVTENGCSVSDDIEIILGTVVQNIDLPIGWSIFSTFLDITDDISTVFASVESEIVIMKNDGGGVYWPIWSINAIGDMVIGEGYQAKMATSQVVTLEDTALVPEETMLSFIEGYNTIAYLRQSAADVEDMMTSIVGLIVIVKNESGSVYWPQYNFNNLGDLIPGKGYKIKLTAATNFYYPANDVVTKSSIIPTETFYYNSVNISENNMVVGFPETIWGDLVNSGDEIGIFDENGKIVGSSVISSNYSAVTIWADDFTTEQKDGLNVGEQYSIKVWNQSQNKEYSVGVKTWIEGSEFYANDAISIVGKLHVISDIDDSYVLYQNAPNPVNETTTISFYLPEDSYVNLEIFNSIGEIVVKLVSQDFNAGEQSVEFNAKDIAAGSYFYKLSTNNFVGTKQFTIE